MSRQLIDSISGGLGNAAGLIATYPLTVVKTRLQTQRKKKEEKKGKDSDVYNGPIDCVKKILKSEGVGGLYKGMMLKVLETYMWNSTFYMFFSMLRDTFKKFRLRTGQDLLAGVLHGMTAGMITQLVLFPLVVINTNVVNRRKSGVNTPRSSSKKLKFVPSWMNEYLIVVLDLYSRNELWKGVSAGLLLTINPGIVTMLRAKMTGATKNYGSKAFRDFWIGFFSKMIASTITYPLVVCRSQIVTEEKQLEHEEGPGIYAPIHGVVKVFRTMNKVIAHGGVSALYSGLAPHLSQAALKEAVANSIRKRLVLFFLSLFLSPKNVTANA